MAYASSSLAQISQSLQPAQPSLWMYSGTDSHATTDGASFFSDGATKGMRVGDLVLVWSTGDGTGKIHRVASVAAPADPRSPGAGPFAATLAS